MTAWHALGRLTYIVAIPALFVYLQFRQRTRVFIVVGDEVLVVKGWMGNGKWHLPGGGLHANEVPFAGAIREVCEETGVELDPSQLVDQGITTYRSKTARFTYHRFIVELKSKVSVRPQKGEITDVRWISLDELTPQNAAADVLELRAVWKNLR